MSVLFILLTILFVLAVIALIYKFFFGDSSATMRVVWVVLLVILILVFYFVYTYFINTSSTLTSSVYLNGTQPTVIPVSSITAPNSANSALGVWIYINSWNNTTKKIVFSTSKNEISLYFDATKPVLYAGIMTGCTPGTQEVEEILITDSFPMQKWAYVIVSLNGIFVDCYLDGKLITSHKLNNNSLAVSCTGNTWDINMGVGFDAYAYNLIRYTEAMTPQKAYQTFYSTAPSSSSTGLLSGMNVNLAIVTNGSTCNATTIV